MSISENKAKKLAEFWTLSPDEAIKLAETDANLGLTKNEALKRLKVYELNDLNLKKIGRVLMTLLLPMTFIAPYLGMTDLNGTFYFFILLVIIFYLIFVEFAKKKFLTMDLYEK